ncbi:helix-turn-helix transcriptional regulator [Rhodovulum sp. ES.010]|uniref:helix-turn-helix transcriptional regulator n=1 Tax=Rhodovulum sp. ES.010 TaxID=1882821 RepID=UPI0015881257|nr:helix-turn-helix transcriptional regulator [Rhodovulum sp. ES.010]
MLSEKLVEVLAAVEVLHLPTTVELRRAYRHVGTALDYMRAHFSDIDTMVEVADACGISTRTLESAFRLVLGTRPYAVLTAFRLEEARRLLSRPDSAPTVTEAAIACGFSHLGRFAAAYRARFGEAPSTTRSRRGAVRHGPKDTARTFFQGAAEFG